MDGTTGNDARSCSLDGKSVGMEPIVERGAPQRGMSMLMQKQPELPESLDQQVQPEPPEPEQEPAEQQDHEQQLEHTLDHSTALRRLNTWGKHAELMSSRSQTRQQRRNDSGESPMLGVLSAYDELEDGEWNEAALKAMNA